MFNSILRGIWASVMATSSMTLAMFQRFSRVPLTQRKPLPPAQLTQVIGDKTGLTDNLSSEMKAELTLFSHYGYGAACGITYALLAPKIAGASIVKGSLFGLAVWAGSYYGLIPGLGLHPSAQKMSKERNIMMAFAHIIWGASLGYSEELLRKKGYQMLADKT